MLIFLDIDGVLVPAKGWQSPEMMKDHFPAFSKEAVRVLRDLITEAVSVILTTSHRAGFSIEEWKAIFKNRGITIANLSTLPNNQENHNRKNEIEHWFRLNTHEERFIIIDDDKSLNDLPDYLKQRLILTNPLVGLREEHLDRIKAWIH